MQGWSAEQVRQRLLTALGTVALAGLWMATGCQSPAGLPSESDEPASADALVPIAPAKVIARGKPEGLSATANGLRSAVLTWSEPAARVYRYRIERAESPDGPYVWVADVSPDKLVYTDGGAADARLKDSTTYYYRMSTIFDKFGLMSEPTPPVKTTTAPPPRSPAGLKAEATRSRAVTLTWLPSDSDGVTGYRVERAPAAAANGFEPVGEIVRDTKLTDGGTAASALKDSTRYLYRVTAINRVSSESAPSAAVEVLTLPPPAPPRRLAAASAEVRCVPLSWEASAERDVVRYDVYQARAAAGPFQKIGEVKGLANTQYIDGGKNPGDLEDEGTYFYRVRAINDVTAESADSETVSAVTRSVPPEVGQVVAVSGRPREIPVSWAKSADQTVIGYEVWRAAAAGDDWTQIVRLNSGDVTSFLDRGGERDGTKLGQLLDGTEYQYKVIAFNTGNVRSSASAVVNATTKLVPVTTAGLTASAGLARSVRLTWRANPEKDVNAYCVEWSKRPDDGFRKLTVVHTQAGVAPAADDMELEPAVTRYYRVKALDREGLESDWCAAAEGSSKPLPDTPTDVKAQNDGAMVNITWRPPAQPDIAQYKVWSKKFLGWELVATTERPEYRLGLTDMPKAMTLAVTAVDRDKLESEKSEPVKVDPQARP